MVISHSSSVPTFYIQAVIDGSLIDVRYYRNRQVRIFPLLSNFRSCSFHSSTRAYKYLEAFAAQLEVYAVEYDSQPITSPNPLEIDSVKASFVLLEKYLDETLHVTWGLLSIFTFTPFLTAFITCGSLGLVAALRRQIDLNLERQAMRFDTRTGEDCPVALYSQEEEKREVSFSESCSSGESGDKRVSVDVREESKDVGEGVEEIRGEYAVVMDGNERNPPTARERIERDEISEVPSLLCHPSSTIPGSHRPARPTYSTLAPNSSRKESSQSLEYSDDKNANPPKRRPGLSSILPGSFQRIAEKKREALINDEAFSHVRDLLRAEQDVIVVRLFPLFLS